MRYPLGQWISPQTPRQVTLEERIRALGSLAAAPLGQLAVAAAALLAHLFRCSLLGFVPILHIFSDDKAVPLKIKNLIFRNCQKSGKPIFFSVINNDS